ncbi:MAG: signal peptidase II [Planctomycetes bacterium]|nr:signal peptidase II [Planctomycetota bacterium]
MSTVDLPISPAPSVAHLPFRSWAPWFWPVAIAVAVLDLWSKAVIFARYPSGAQFSWWGETTYNTGVAWGLFGSYPHAVTVLTLLLIPALAVVWWTQFRTTGRPANLAFGCIIGGAVGNAWDRVMTSLVGPAGGYSGVRDFIRIDLHGIGIPYVWPNFNVADAAISTGFVILVSLVLFKPMPRTGLASR